MMTETGCSCLSRVCGSVGEGCVVVNLLTDSVVRDLL
jgi:hypothetical protein